MRKRKSIPHWPINQYAHALFKNVAYYKVLMENLLHFPLCCKILFYTVSYCIYKENTLIFNQLCTFQLGKYIYNLISVYLIYNENKFL